MEQLLSNHFSVFPYFLGFCKSRGMWNLTNYAKVMHSVEVKPDIYLWSSFLFSHLSLERKPIQDESS